MCGAGAKRRRRRKVPPAGDGRSRGGRSRDGRSRGHCGAGATVEQGPSSILAGGAGAEQHPSRRSRGRAASEPLHVPASKRSLRFSIPCSFSSDSSSSPSSFSFQCFSFVKRYIFPCTFPLPPAVCLHLQTHCFFCLSTFPVVLFFQGKTSWFITTRNGVEEVQVMH